MTVFGGHVTTASDGTVTSTLNNFGVGLGWVMGGLVAVVAFTSGLTWIMGSDRTLAVSCYDGAGPRGLGKFSARFGTPLRVNVLSGVVSTAIFIAAEEITGGNAYKFFAVALNLAISTTLISYLGIFPAAWVLRHKRPQDPRPYKSPLIALTTIVSVLLITFCTIETIFPGAGDKWFGDDYRPSDQWTQNEKWSYLLTVAVPLVLFLAISVWFWFMGKRHREQTLRELDAGLPESVALSK
jgi:amino acid transporter